jgi:hypothetical protein
VRSVTACEWRTVLPSNLHVHASNATDHWLPNSCTGRMSPGGTLAKNTPMEASQLKPALQVTFSNVPESPDSPFEERGV